MNISFFHPGFYMVIRLNGEMLRFPVELPSLPDGAEIIALPLLEPKYWGLMRHRQARQEKEKEIADQINTTYREARQRGATHSEAMREVRQIQAHQEADSEPEAPPVWEIFGLTQDSKLTIGWQVIQYSPPGVRKRFMDAIRELLNWPRPVNDKIILPMCPECAKQMPCSCPYPPGGVEIPDPEVETMICEICGKEAHGKTVYQWADGYPGYLNDEATFSASNKAIICETCGEVIEAFINFLKEKAREPHQEK